MITVFAPENLKATMIIPGILKTSAAGSELSGTENTPRRMTKNNVEMKEGGM